MQRAYHEELAAVGELDDFRDYDVALTALIGRDDIGNDNFDAQFVASR